MLFHAWLTKRFTCQIKFPPYYTVSQEKVPGDWRSQFLIQQKLMHTDRGFEGPQWSQVGNSSALWCKGEKASKTGSTKTPQHTHAILFLGFSMERWILKLGKSYLGSAIIKRNRYLWRIRNDVFANKIGALLELHQTHVRIISLMPGKGIKSYSPDDFGGFSLLWMWQFNPQPWLFLWLLLVILKDLHVVCLQV